MASNLKLEQGTNGAWFIYQNGQAIIGGHKKEIVEKVFQFLLNEKKL
jgi:hypothetical protein